MKVECDQYTGNGEIASFLTIRHAKPFTYA